MLEIKDQKNVLHIPKPLYSNNCILNEHKEKLDVYFEVDKIPQFNIPTMVLNTNHSLTLPIIINNGVTYIPLEFS